MEQLTINTGEETVQPQNQPITLQEKIQLLIDNFSKLKEKYNYLTEEKNKVENDYLELDDLYGKLKNENEQMIQKISEMQLMIDNLNNENNSLKSQCESLDNITKVAASKIDLVLSQLEI